MLVPTQMALNVRRLESFCCYASSLIHNANTHLVTLSFFAPKVFLCTADTPWLDGKHVVFGKVISGQSVLSAIEQVGSESGSTRLKGKEPFGNGCLQNRSVRVI